MNKQLQIDFTPHQYAGFATCREFIAMRSLPLLMDKKGLMQKMIAADMDLSPSHLSRKLSGNGDNRFTLDDLELYVRKTGDVEPVKYLAHVFLCGEESAKDKEIRKLREQLANLEDKVS